MGKMIKSKFRKNKKDELCYYQLFEMYGLEGDVFLTFETEQNGEVISYDRLKEIHEMIAKMLEIGRKDYEEFRASENKERKFWD